MIDVSDPNAILSIKKPGDLFSRDDDKAKDEYRRLAKMYHPDRNGGVDQMGCFAHISILYGRAEKLLKEGKWEQSDYVELVDVAGNKYAIKPQGEKQFELGSIYIEPEIITYIINQENKRFYDNAISRIRNIKFQDEKMKNTMGKFFPSIIKSYTTKDGSYVISIAKTKEVFQLSDILSYFKGAIEDRHVAWIITRLSSICCYLDYAGLSHNGISIDNCFISPEFHSIMLYGGWWYCVGSGQKMIGTQKQIFDIMPIKTKTEKTGNIQTDLESVKDIGRRLLGKNKAPDAFLKWLDSGTSMSAQREFAKWDKALQDSYGARKFVTMEVDPNKIY